MNIRNIRKNKTVETTAWTVSRLSVRSDQGVVPPVMALAT